MTLWGRLHEAMEQEKHQEAEKRNMERDAELKEIDKEMDQKVKDAEDASVRWQAPRARILTQAAQPAASRPRIYNTVEPRHLSASPQCLVVLRDCLHTGARETRALPSADTKLRKVLNLR